MLSPLNHTSQGRGHIFLHFLADQLIEVCARYNGNMEKLILEIGREKERKLGFLKVGGRAEF